MRCNRFAPRYYSFLPPAVTGARCSLSEHDFAGDASVPPCSYCLHTFCLSQKKKSNTHPSTAQDKYMEIRGKGSRRPLIISQLGVTAAGAKHSLHPIIIRVHLLFYQISAQYQIAPAGQGTRVDPLPVLSQG